MYIEDLNAVILQNIELKCLKRSKYGENSKSTKSGEFLIFFYTIALGM